MPTLDIQIAASADDAAESDTGTVTTGGTTTSNDLDAVNEWYGCRFAVPDILSGATIDVAYLTVRPTAAGGDEPLVTIYCEAADTAAVFTTGASSISGRSRTTASVAWSSADLGSDGTNDFNTPSLVAPIQEVINRAGWSAGNYLAVLVTSQGTANRDLTIRTFDHADGAAAAPRLHIEYTNPAAPSGRDLARMSLLGVA